MCVASCIRAVIWLTAASDAYDIAANILHCRLTHLRPADLMVISKLRSLFCLILAAPCVNGALYPGFASAVRLQQVEEIVSSSLQYCNIELQAEPEMTSVVL